MAVNIRVAMSPGGPDGCAFYRQFLPHLHTPGSNYLYSAGPLDPALYRGYSATVVQRMYAPPHAKALSIFKQMGLKVVYDLDDNLWEVPRYNPAFPLVKANQEGFGACVKMCDVMTVSTAALKVAAHRHTKTKIPIVEIPNAIDFDLFSVLPRNPDYVKVGWGGSNSHTSDVRQVFELLVDLVRADSKLRVDFVGLPAPERLKNHAQVIQRDWIPTGEYPSRLSSWRWDILLAPLEDNTFNNSKSSIKILEAAAIGAVVLVSDVGEYRKFCRLDPELKYLACSSMTDWKRKIQELTAEPERRAHYVEIMRRVVLEHYDIHKVASKWHDLFNSLR